MKRIAIFHHEGYLDSVPCLMSSIELLSQRGYFIDIFMLQDDQYIRPHIPDKKVSIYFMPKISNFILIFRMLNLGACFYYAWKKCRKKRYNYIFGIDPLGLIIATQLGRVLKKPVIYFSLELYLSYEIKSVSMRLLKILERWCIVNTVATIIQDNERAKLIALDNRIPLSKIITLPNSTHGNAERRKSLFLHKRYNIDQKKKIILQAGTLESWTLSLELAQVAQFWPEDWILVLHTKEYRKGDSYITKLKKYADGDHVILSMEPVPYNELPDLIASADIGLALYKSNSHGLCGTNLSAIGLSSGKIAQYLKSGVPVVATNFNYLNELFNELNCGVTVEHPAEVVNAINKILKDYECFSNNAVNCYNDMYSFEKAFSKVVNILNCKESIS